MGIIIKMGMKFYRGADKPKKIRKRFTQSRSWFRTFKWTCYHAHPLNIIGHEFKGGMYLSTGYLAHPHMNGFALDDATLFAPPRPDAWAQNQLGGALLQLSPHSEISLEPISLVNHSLSLTL